MALDLKRLIEDPEYDPTREYLGGGADPERYIPKELRTKKPKPPRKERPGPAYPYLPEDEQRSIVREVANLGIGGLQWIGETLDKPGRAIRGVAAGKPKELLNLLPFSDTAGITDPQESVSGRDLLAHHGLVPKTNKPGLDPSDIAGFVTEVATDPLSYLGFGSTAVAKEAGAVAKAAGLPLKTTAQRSRTLREALKGASESTLKTASEAAEAAGTTLEKLADKPIGGAFSFTSGPLGLFGVDASHVPAWASSPTAQKVMKAAADAPENLTRSIPIVGNALADTAGAANLIRKGLFSYGAGGHFNKYAQQASEYATAARKPAAARGEMHAFDVEDLIVGLNKTAREAFGSKFSDEELDVLVRKAAQLAMEHREKGGAPAVKHAIAEVFGPHMQAPPLGPETVAFRGHSPTPQPKLPAPAPEVPLGGTPGPLSVPPAAPSAGGPLRVGRFDKLTKHFSDVVNHLVDIKDTAWKEYLETGGSGKTLVDNQHIAPIGHGFRQFVTDGLKGAHARLARMLRTSYDNAIGRVPAIKYVSAHSLNRMMEDPALRAVINDPNALTYQILLKYKRDVLAAQATHAIETKKGITAQDIAGNLAEWLRTRQGAGRFNEDVVSNMRKGMAGVEVSKANMEAIHDLFHDNLVKSGLAGPGMDASSILPNMTLKEAFKHVGMSDKAVNHFAQRFGADAVGMRVPVEVADAAKAFAQKLHKPEWQERIMDIVDTFTQPLKKNLTLPFPSFLVRNRVSGIGMNFMGGEIRSTKDFQAYRQSAKMTKEMLKDPNAYLHRIREAVAYDAIPKDWESLGVELGKGGIHHGALEHIPEHAALLSNPQGFWQNLKSGWEDSKAEAFGTNHGDITQSLNKVPGFQRARAIAETPAHVGARFNHQVEFQNRMELYNYLRDHKKWSPEAASKKVRQLQVTYDELAPMEKDLMRRLVPFYTYASKTIPAMIGQLAERPGGMTAQIVRASNIGRSEGEFVPPYVGEGMSVNLGGDRYLSQLGLPTDQFSDLFVTGPTGAGTIKRTGQKMLSMMNPYLKGPLELATGQSFFTGRPIEESFRHPSNNILLNQALHNSPAARFMTTGRQLMDERKKGLGGLITKAVNALTGARISDVSGGLEKQKRIAESRILAELLREYPEIAAFTDVYPKKGQTLKPGSREEILYRAYQGLKQVQRAANLTDKEKERLAKAA